MTIRTLMTIPNLDHKLFKLLLGLYAFYIVYYLLLAVGAIVLGPLPEGVWVSSILYRMPFLTLAGIAITAVLLPFATRAHNRKKRYVVAAFITFLVILPILIWAEAFLRTDWSFVH